MNKRKPRPRIALARAQVNGLALTPSQDQLWSAANDDLTSNDPQRRRRGQIALRALETELAARDVDDQIDRGIDETIALARGRGETIEVAKAARRHRRIRIRSRDGLETLAATGAISTLQQRAGLLYRDLYEATDPERDLRSQMASGAMAGAGGKAAPGTAEAWAERRLRLCRAMAGLEAKVRLADRNGCAVRALREVAGHARCISHFVAGGGSQAVHRRALGLALDICVSHFGLR
jgi:hypothetical protein